MVYKKYVARCVVSRPDGVEVRSRATAQVGARFLARVPERMPFPIRAIQAEGGSEYEAEFEGKCERRGIPLFVLPPRSPKSNGHVQRAQRTQRGEFY